MTQSVGRHASRAKVFNTSLLCILNCKEIIMQLLPAELKCHIIMLSSDSPSSLAALARTHSDYQREAEKALYHTLVISAYSNDCLKCMETLATNSEKAALVRTLIVEYNRGGINNERVTSYLSKSLINMHSLSDLRIRSRLVQATGEMVKCLGKILWSVCKILIFSQN